MTPTCAVLSHGLRRGRMGALWRWAGAAVVLAVPLAAWSVGMSGCSDAGAEMGCPLAAECGGDPTGSWLAQSVCQYIPPESYSANALFPQQTTPQTPKLAKPPPSGKASGDWCSQLLYRSNVDPNTNSHVTFVNLFHAPAPVVFTTVIMTPDHQYQFAVKARSANVTHFAPMCLTGNGANPSCTDLAAQLIAYYGPTPNFDQIACTSAPDGGCDCSYYFELVSADQGSWHTTGNALTFYSNQAPLQLTTTTTYCAQGGKLTMTGFNGQSLFAVTGLRTLFMAPGT